MSRRSLFAPLLLSVLFLWASIAEAGPLRVLSSNPRYFTDGSGRAIYLTGSHVHENVQDIDSFHPPAPYDYAAYLDRITRLGHNFMRMWSWESAQQRNLENGNFAIIEPTIWMRTGPGTALDGRPKFDLTRLNQAYFDRLRSRIIAARDRGIYVSVMLFEGWMLQFMEHQGHPFQAENNVNGIDGDPDGDRRPIETHRVSLNSPIGEIQKAYVRKVIDTVNDLDNVLYEVSNEDGGGTVQWQYDLISYIRSYEAGKPAQHAVGMTYRYEGGTNEELFASPADWISLGGSFTVPPAADGRKVILSDTDHMMCMGCVDDRDWVWRSFTRGENPLLMEHPAARILEPPGGILEAARERMGQTLVYANKMNLAAMTPRGDLSSTAYALANPGAEYLVYQPTAGSPITVNLVPGAYTYEWFNPSTGGTVETGSLTAAAGDRSFAPPFSGDAVLYLKASLASPDSVPVATGLSPSSLAVGGIAFTLNVIGSNFVTGSVVRWKGADRPTTYLSTEQLTAAVTAADIAAAGPAAVTVFNPAPGGGISNTLTFTVTAPDNPVPIASTLSPASATAGGAAFTLTVTGSNFVAGSVVRWKGADRPTTYQSAGQLTAAIGTADIATAGPAAVTVLNPTPGGGTSSALTFTVTAPDNPVPVASTLSPASANMGAGAFTLTVTGSNFVTGSVVRWKGVDRPTTYQSAGQLTAAIGAPDIAAAGPAAVTVFNPAPGGGTSNALTFTVGSSPTLAVSATSVAPGTAVTVTLQGGAGGAQDWLALAAQGAPNTSYAAWTYVGAGVTTRTWTVPVGGGSWEFRLFVNNGFTRVATSPSVASSSTLTVSATSVAPGTAVTTTLQGGAGGGTDWLALAAVGAPNTSFLQWVYVGAGVTTRTWTPTTPGPGTYEFRYFLNNGFTKAASSLSFTVSGNNPVPGLTSSATSVPAGGTSTVTLTNGLGGAQDWLALAAVGAPNTTYLQWVYVGAGVATRTWTPTTPGPGTYEFRYFLDNGYTRSATSPSFTVQ